MNFIKELNFKLACYDDEKINKILSDNEIINIIINEHPYYLTWFFQEANSSHILKFINKETIKQINTSNFIKKHIIGIVTCNNEALNILFENELFCELVYQNIDFVYSVSGYLNLTANKLLCDYIIKKEDTIALKKFLIYNSYENQLSFVKNHKYDLYKYNDILIDLDSEVINYLLKNYPNMNNVILEKMNINFLNTKNILFPTYIFNKDEFNILTHDYNFLEYRTIINKMEKINDVSILENKRKEFIDNILLETLEYGMFKRYFDLLKNNDINNIEFNDIKELFYIYQKLLQTNDDSLLKTFLINDTKLLTENMIIDYHFEDISYNVIKEIKNILNYIKMSNFKISDEQLYLYEQILNFNNLSQNELLKIHDILKKNNQKELLYDIVNSAKNDAYTKMKEEMINENNYNKYINIEKTKQLGVTVLELDGQPFRMLIKSFGENIEDVLNTKANRRISDGGSYSYIGNEKLNTFNSPKENYNFVFTDFEPLNILHTHITDSFTSYSHEFNMKSSMNSTNRINQIMSPTEFIKSSLCYNEVLFAQNSKNKKYHNIKSNPKMSFILCYDEIKQSQIESAKNLNLGIVLVNTKKYKQSINDDAIFILENEKENNYYEYINYENSPIKRYREDLFNSLINKNQKKL